MCRAQATCAAMLLFLSLCQYYVLCCQGGDLMRAIQNDTKNELRWSRKGGLLMLDIARGLTFLHANKVSDALAVPGLSAKLSVCPVCF